MFTFAPMRCFLVRLGIYRFSWNAEPKQYLHFSLHSRRSAEIGNSSRTRVGAENFPSSPPSSRRRSFWFGVCMLFSLSTEKLSFVLCCVWWKLIWYFAHFAQNHQFSCTFFFFFFPFLFFPIDAQQPPPTPPNVHVLLILYTLRYFFFFGASQENSEFLHLNQNQLHQSSVNVGYSNIAYNPDSSRDSGEVDEGTSTEKG